MPPPPAVAGLYDPGPHEVRPPRLKRRRSTWWSVSATLGAVVALIVVLVVVLAGQSNGPSQHRVATFVPVRSSVTTQQLEDVTNQMTSRLRAVGDDTDVAAVRGRTVVVFGTTKLPVPASVLVGTGTIQFRPALCGADAYAPSRTGATPGPLPSGCSAPQYSLMAPTLTVDTSTGNSNIAAIPLDPSLASYRSSTPTDNADSPDKAVLVPLVGGGGERYLLGPSELSGAAVAGAQAAFQSPNWVVNATLTETGSAAWDALADNYFHEIIGIDFDGRIISAPLTQPAQSTFTSFAGRVQISGNFTKASADDLAAELTTGPLAVRLRVRS